MPRRPKHPCHHPGCPNTTEKRFCEEHEKEDNAWYERNVRDRSTKKRYGRNWQYIRERYVMTHPFCEECFTRGVIVPVAEVHHKIPLVEGGTHDPDNLISLCGSCHAKAHAKRKDRPHSYDESES